ncbi:unnamed protein product [Candidula unifasciata]|uniref:Uncharacterized protein n=1 Tax=Candidula unifasciata TaxID=100452 RepID=A0A8S3ZKT1_9EUPU|nr:unnamed protein product [Candidula unifasciata]
MGKWQQRSVVFKLALLFMYFIFLVYALAFSIPTWLGGGLIFGLLEKDIIFGLWAICKKTSDSGGFETCEKMAFGDNTPWMDGVRAVWVAGMFFYVVAVFYSLVDNCCTREDSRDYGLTGALAILAGLSGAVGVIVVAIKIEEDSPNVQYYWGYMLACITSGLTLILAIILLITKNTKSSEKAQADRTADYVFAHKQPNPYAQEYTNQGYTRDDIPLANGVTYHHTPTAHPYTAYQDGYTGTNYPPTRSQEPIYGQPHKSPYGGYYNGRPAQLHDASDVGSAYTDLSNGYTTELIQAEHTLSRPGAAQRADFVRGAGDYARQEYPGRNDNFANGSRLY